METWRPLSMRTRWGKCSPFTRILPSQWTSSSKALSGRWAPVCCLSILLIATAKWLLCFLNTTLFLHPAPAHRERWDLRPGNGPLPLRECQRRNWRDHVHTVLTELCRGHLPAESRADHVWWELLQGKYTKACCMLLLAYGNEFTQSSASEKFWGFFPKGTSHSQQLGSWGFIFVFLFDFFLLVSFSSLVELQPRNLLSTFPDCNKINLGSAT